MQRDHNIVAAIAPDLERAQQEIDRPIGVELASDIAREHKREAPLGNLVADLMRRAWPGADVAFNNGGALRTSLRAGPAPATARCSRCSRSTTRSPCCASRRARWPRSSPSTCNPIEGSSRCPARAPRRNAKAARSRSSCSATTASASRRTRRCSVVTSDFLATGGDGLLRDIQSHRRDARSIRTSWCETAWSTASRTIPAADRRRVPGAVRSRAPTRALRRHAPLLHCP